MCVCTITEKKHSPTKKERLLKPKNWPTVYKKADKCCSDWNTRHMAKSYILVYLVFSEQFASCFNYVYGISGRYIEFTLCVQSIVNCSLIEVEPKLVFRN